MMRSIAKTLLAASVLAVGIAPGAVAEGEPTRGGTLNYINQTIGGHFNTNIASGTLFETTPAASSDFTSVHYI